MSYKESPELTMFSDYREQVRVLSEESPELKNFEFINNSVGMETKTKTVDWIEYQYNNSKIVSLAPHLQRVLLDDIWKAKNNKKAKSYIRSIWHGMGELTAMTLVKAEVLSENIKEMLEKEKNVELIEQIKEVQKAVDLAIKNGAEWINTDGQSRSECGIIPYLKSNFNLSDDSFEDPIDVFHPKTEENKTEGFKDVSIKKFGDLLGVVKGIFLSKKLTINIITKGTLKQVSDALIAINSNEKWKEWQKIFCNANPSVFKARINGVMKNSPLKDFLMNRMKQESDRYKIHYSGLELFVAESLSWLKKKSTPDMALLKQMVNGTETSPETEHIQFFEKIIGMWVRNYTSIKKVKPIVLSSFVDFMEVIKKSGNKNDGYIPQFGTIPKFNILSDNKFLDWYLKTINNFEAKTMSNSSHYYKVNGKWAYVQDGWPSHCSGTYNAASKIGRIKWLLDALQNSMDELLRDRVLSNEHSMPDMPTIMSHNNHIDSEGNKINLAKTNVNYERGHENSKARGGDNSLDNLKPQRKESNRQYSDKDMITV